jgi:class 3 adenylate cyclase
VRRADDRSGPDATRIRLELLLQRLAGTPRSQALSWRMILETDVRDVLTRVSAPTLVLSSIGDRPYPTTHARYVVGALASAESIERRRDDHFNLCFEEDASSIADIIEEFVTGNSARASQDRVLSTVLFTDIVSSTEHAALVGDRRWRSMLDRHDHCAQRQIERFRGRVLKSTGDGVVASFDGPARAVRSAGGLREHVRELGLQIRVGIHCAEVELRDHDISGLAVVIAQRIMTTAQAGEILVSSTIRDLVLGSEIRFESLGERALKAVRNAIHIFSVEE